MNWLLGGGGAAAVAAATLAAGLLTTDTSQAQFFGFGRAEAVTAYDCQELKRLGKAADLAYQGFFAGVKNGMEGRESISTSACFTSQQQCRTWLSGMRREYSLSTLRDECVRGGG